MTGETRDGFGWEYYVGRYDGLGRRRRRWLRNLKRMGGVSLNRRTKMAGSFGLEQRKLAPSTATKTMASAPKKGALHYPSLLRVIQEQYNFKGFGWSFYKSFLSRRGIGASLRLPLSSNFDFYEQHAAWPFISSSTYFGYPWVVAMFLNASLPLEAVKWAVGGVFWKFRWAIAVMSAFIRGVVETVIWFLMLPWRIWRAWTQMVGFATQSIFKVFAIKSKDMKTAESSLESIDEESDDNILKNKDGSVDGFIEMSHNSQGKDDGETTQVSATAVMESPRGGAN